MQKRKIYFETRQSDFSQCITAVGKGLRQSWGIYNTNRKAAIAHLKKKCENWSNLAENHVKLSWHSRKLRTLIFNLQDLSYLLKFEFASYSGKEINWMRKIMRSLKKSIEKHKDSFGRLAVELKDNMEGIFHVSCIIVLIEKLPFLFIFSSPNPQYKSSCRYYICHQSRHSSSWHYSCYSPIEPNGVLPAPSSCRFW